jgi:hypothetical protein
MTTMTQTCRHQTVRRTLAAEPCPVARAVVVAVMMMMMTTSRLAVAAVGTMTTMMTRLAAGQTLATFARPISSQDNPQPAVAVLTMPGRHAHSHRHHHPGQTSTAISTRSHRSHQAQT